MSGAVLRALMTGIPFMARLIFCLVIVAFASAFAPIPADAQVSPRTCGLTDGPGCNPYQCGLLDGPGCVSQAQVGGFGENLQLTLGTRDVAEARKPDGQLNTLRDLFKALRACWSPPAADDAYRGMQMSMRFSFNAEGKLIGAPRVTYASRNASQKTRDLYHDALAQSLQDCVPLSFTRSFAGAIAGRPIVIRVIENRDNAGIARQPT
jgi:hypothetical protein